jgi:SAM-dependent methyltransferase
MRLLDAGCGPGSITLGLAQAVAPGEAVGIDTNAAAIEAARSAASAARTNNATFVQGDVYQLPFAAETFDAAFGHAVFQHLDEPEEALAEMYRVLVPGAVIGLADADYDGSLIWPVTPGLLRAIQVQTVMRDRAGGDARVGRRLGGLLAATGFVDVEVSATATCEGSPEVTRRTGEASARYLEAPAFQERASALGVAEIGEFPRLAAAWREWGAAPGACWARFWMHAIGRKP